MNDVDPRLDRLLRAAARGADDVPVQAPFGFDTRVVAVWRAGQFGNGNGATRFIRRVAFMAVTVIVIASAAALYEINRDRDIDESFGNEYAIADSAIQNEF